MSRAEFLKRVAIKPENFTIEKNFHSDEKYRFLINSIGEAVKATIILNEKCHTHCSTLKSSYQDHPHILEHYKYYYIVCSSIQRALEIVIEKRKKGYNHRIEMALTYVNPWKLECRGDYRYLKNYFI
jgi:hypothetical protein